MTVDVADTSKVKKESTMQLTLVTAVDLRKIRPFKRFIPGLKVFFKVLLIPKF